MASVSIPEQNREITEVTEMREFLKPFGIWYENWELESRVSPDASNEEILSAYKPEIDRLKQQGGFVTADVINVNPATPGLEAMLHKFNREHTHSEDEVRFVIKGSGVFHVHPENGPVFAITVESGDMINVPRGTQHWFNLCQDKMIRCIRFFEDPSGWTPHYMEHAVHEDYAPLCLGPSYLRAEGKVDSPVKL